jgi:hypothetical protein
MLYWPNLLYWPHSAIRKYWDFTNFRRRQATTKPRDLCGDSGGTKRTASAFSFQLHPKSLGKGLGFTAKAVQSFSPNTLQEETMTASPKFFFTVHPEGHDAFVAVCTMSGDSEAFHSLKRHFAHAEEIERALAGAGISRERYVTKLQQLESESETSLEVDQNEAQKIGILHTESTE